LNETDLGYRERNCEGMMGNAEGKKLLKMEDLKLLVGGRCSFPWGSHGLNQPSP